MNPCLTGHKKNPMRWRIGFFSALFSVLNFKASRPKETAKQLVGSK